MKRLALTSLFFALIILIVYLADRGNSPEVFDWVRNLPGGDKAGHFLLIGGLAFMFNYGLNLHCIRLFGRRWLTGSLIVLVLATLEEFSQLHFRTRTFDWVDLAFDCLGIWCFGFLAARLLRPANL